MCRWHRLIVLLCFKSKWNPREPWLLPGKYYQFQTGPFWFLLLTSLLNLSLSPPTYSWSSPGLSNADIIIPWFHSVHTAFVCPWLWILSSSWLGSSLVVVLTGASVLLALTSLPHSPITHLQVLCNALLQRLTHEAELAYLWFSTDWHRGDVLRSMRRTVFSTYTRQRVPF